MLSVGDNSMGQTSVQLACPWQRNRASSERRSRHRSAPAPSLLSVMSVKARLSAAGPVNCSFQLTIVQADRHAPQPMHSMARSI